MIQGRSTASNISSAGLFKGTTGQGILTKEGNVTLEMYYDAHFAGSIIDSRSTTRYYAFIRGSLVT